MPRRNAEVAILPNIQAVMRGVRPLKSAALTATPAWNHNVHRENIDDLVLELLFTYHATQSKL